MAKPKKIHTVASLLERTVEVGQCKEWTGYFAGKSPAVFHEGRLQSARRILCLLIGKHVPEGHFVTTSCRNQKCVNPDHLLTYTPRQHMSYMAAQVQYMNPKRILKLSVSAQGRRKLSDDQIKVILSGEDSCVVLAKEFHVNKSLISKIRRGEAHRMTLARNNPYWSLYG
jgi:hypothetical protein